MAAPLPTQRDIPEPPDWECPACDEFGQVSQTNIEYRGTDPKHMTEFVDCSLCGGSCWISQKEYDTWNEENQPPEYDEVFAAAVLARGRQSLPLMPPTHPNCRCSLPGVSYPRSSYRTKWYRKHLGKHSHRPPHRSRLVPALILVLVLVCLLLVVWAISVAVIPNPLKGLN